MGEFTEIEEGQSGSLSWDWRCWVEGVEVAQANRSSEVSKLVEPPVAIPSGFKLLAFGESMSTHKESFPPWSCLNSGGPTGKTGCSSKGAEGIIIGGEASGGTEGDGNVEKAAPGSEVSKRTGLVGSLVCSPKEDSPGRQFPLGSAQLWLTFAPGRKCHKGRMKFLERKRHRPLSRLRIISDAAH